MILKFKKWLNGDITWKEEKELRQEARQDDFLADAIEGYEEFPVSNHIQKVHQLNQKIRQRSNTISTTFLSRAIAASLLVILSAGSLWFINFRMGGAANEQVVYNPAVEARKEVVPKSIEEIAPTETPEKFVEDSKEEGDISNIISLESNSSQLVLSPTSPTKPTENSATVAELTTARPLKELEYPKRQLPTVVKEETITQIQQQPSATKISPPTEASTIEALSTQHPTQESAFVENKTTDKTASEKIPIAAAARRALSPAAAPIILSDLDTHAIYSAVPTSQSFQEFVRSHLRYPKAAKKNKVQGVVRLSYQVTPKGTVDYIQVIDSLGYGCEEEAIRLLKLFNFPTTTPLLDTCVIEFMVRD